MSKIQEINWVLISIYGKLIISDNDFNALFNLMTHDKKNEKNLINFTLLKDIGQISIDQHCTKEEIFEALRFFRET